MEDIDEKMAQHMARKLDDEERKRKTDEGVNMDVDTDQPKDQDEHMQKENETEGEEAEGPPTKRMRGDELTDMDAERDPTASGSGEAGGPLASRGVAAAGGGEPEQMNLSGLEQALPKVKTPMAGGLTQVDVSEVFSPPWGGGDGRQVRVATG